MQLHEVNDNDDLTEFVPKTDLKTEFNQSSFNASGMNLKAMNTTKKLEASNGISPRLDNFYQS